MFDRMKSWFGYGASETGPTYLLSDPRVGEVFSYGARSATGVSITQQTALTCSAWWRALNLLSDAIAKVPYGVYRNLPDGKGKVVDPEHEWHYPLARKPGTYWTAFQFRKLMIMWAASRGNAYAYIDRTNRTLQPISPDELTPVAQGARLFYHHTGSGKIYNSDEILHYKGPGYDGISGLSVLENAAESLGLNLGSKRFQAATLKNSARPSVLLKFPRKLEDQKRKIIRDDWERMMGGVDNANRTVVIDGEFEVVPFAMNSTDIQLIETQKFTVRDISNFTGVPVHKLGDKEGASYNSLEQETLGWNVDTLEAWYVNVEQEDEDKLLTEDQKTSGSHEIAFDRVKAAFASADLAAKSNYLRVALGGAPYMQISEARRMDNLNHVDGTDEIPQPANMGGQQNDPNNPANDGPGKPSAKLKEATAAALDQGVRRVFKRLGAQLKAADKRGDREKWAAAFKADNLGPVSAELAALEMAAGEAHGVDIFGKVAGQILSHIERLCGNNHSGADWICYELDAFHLFGNGVLPNDDSKKKISAEQQREANGQFGSGSGEKLSPETQKVVDKIASQAEKRGEETVRETAARVGQSPAEVSAKLNEAYSKAEVTVNIHNAFGEHLAAAGEIKNAYETGNKPKGYMAARTKQEGVVLGTTSETPNNERPRYGAVNFGGNLYGGASQYGNGVIVLNKEHLASRLTMVSGNSFGHRDDKGTATGAHPLNAIAQNGQALRAAGIPHDSKGINQGYTEAHVWGNLSLNKNTVREIRFPASEANTRGVQALQSFAQKNGIPFRFFHDTTGKTVSAADAAKAAPKPAASRGGFFRRLFGG